MGLFRRSVTSSAYNITANSIQVVVLLVRSIILSRLLSPEIFGVYALATSIVAITRVVPSFGLSGAYIHRAPESEGETALRVHFTLLFLFSAVWAVLLAVGAAVFASGETKLALWVIIATTFVVQLTQTPRAYLRKGVLFRRLAALQLAVTLLGSVIAVGLAWKGYGLWSLLWTNIVSAALAVVLLYLVWPVWRPRFGWSTPVVRYFVSYGSKIFAGTLLAQALDNLDDIWTGAVLGNAALGYYNRAYRFASYPRQVLASPINGVAIGTYAQLKTQRKRLSQAFFRINALLIRANFLLAGFLALVAPELIRILLGVKWLPMVDVFRLMLVYTLLDPIKITIGNVITTSGAPEKVVRARLVQLVVLALGLGSLGTRFGIEGVAVAVNLMILIGIGLLLWQVRAYVDYSLGALFVAPLISLASGMAVAYVVARIPIVAGSTWSAVIAKTVVFTSVYLLILGMLERERLPLLVGMYRRVRSEYWGRKAGLGPEDSEP